jgi:hypothetical protein
MSGVEPIYLTWLNPYGGFEYFFFTAQKEYQLNVIETGQTTQNVFPQWPKSWGEYADTVDKTTFRRLKKAVVVRSQHLTPNQRDVLIYIKSSPVVQIVYSRTNRRTVIVDDQSFKIYDESENQYMIAFTITYTDEIASQRV